MDRYGNVARALHWIMAILILFNLFLGFAHDALPRDWKVMPVHKSIGLTVLALAVARILWRFTRRAPALPAGMPAWERGAAHATHFAFYAFMLVLPLTGWIMISAGDRPLNWFFLFDVPKFAVAKGDAIVGISGEAHEILGFAWAALLVLHGLAAMRHHFILKDGVLRRMI
ncbi:cytochrome b [Sphingobium sp. TA15]|uniref:Cytochrome B561 n=1 Tax=Sphingobium indicum (strain DSM 16413 / CCM 7287 / MTCC 6362 / UT26 / NBRC 101211 / UT26S) TaxID=452662 RepID=D4Z6H3_SPHIU|nr:cytochrome b [Sphingobium indicum]BAI98205.1 cytochrome B561 [Sphingobium indicum UT26S]BDD67580.1 cytochrome b [Sphingobium sp. TA15]